MTYSYFLSKCVVVILLSFFQDILAFDFRF